MTLYEEIIWEGSDGDLPISQVHWLVSQHNPTASTAEIQEKTLDLIRSLVSDGLFILGAMTGKKGLFEAWDDPLDESIRKIRARYVDHFPNGHEWHWSAWLCVTDKGRRAADHIEQRYFSDRSQ